MNYNQNLPQQNNNSTIEISYNDFKAGILKYIYENDKQKNEKYPTELYSKFERALREYVFEIFVKEAYDLIREIFIKNNKVIESEIDITEVAEKILDKLIRNGSLHELLIRKIDETYDNILNALTKVEIEEILNVEKDTLKDNKGYLNSSSIRHLKVIIKTRAELTLGSYIVFSVVYLLHHFIKSKFVSLNFVEKYTSELRKLGYTIVHVNRQFVKYAFIKYYRNGLMIIQHSAIEEDYNVRVQMRSLIMKAHYNNPDFSDKTLLLLALRYLLTSQLFKNNFFKIRKLILYLRILYNRAAFVILSSMKVKKLIDNDEVRRYKYMVFNGPIGVLESDQENPGLFARNLKDIEEIDDDLENLLDIELNYTLFKIQDSLTLELFKQFKNNIPEKNNNINGNKHCDERYDLCFYVNQLIQTEANLERKVLDYLNSIEFLLAKFSVEYDYLRKQYLTVDEGDFQLYIKPQVNIFWLVDTINIYLRNFGEILTLKSKPTQMFKFLRSVNDKTITKYYKNYINEIRNPFIVHNEQKQQRMYKHIYTLLKYSYQVVINIDELTGQRRKRYIKQIRNYFDILKKSQIQINPKIVEDLIEKNFEKLKPFLPVIQQLLARYLNNSVFIVPFINHVIPYSYLADRYKDLHNFILKQILSSVDNLLKN